MYFKNFPSIYYPFNIKGNEQIKIVKDITRNVRIIKDIVSSITLYELYDIQNDESPEIVSERLYGTPTYHWILMILNDRYDYISDWPQSQAELDKFVTQKYGEGNEDLVHHYENNGFVVNSNVVGASAVSNRTYEERINESKRTIKVLSNDIMAKIVNQFEDIIA